MAGQKNLYQKAHIQKPSVRCKSMDTSKEKNIAAMTISYRPGADVLSIWVKGGAVDYATEDDFTVHELMEDFSIRTLTLNGVEVFAGASVIETAKIAGWKALLSSYLPDEVIYMVENLMEASTIVPFGLTGDGPVVLGGSVKMELFVNLDLFATQFA